MLAVGDSRLGGPRSCADMSGTFGRLGPPRGARGRAHETRGAPIRCCKRGQERGDDRAQQQRSDVAAERYQEDEQRRGRYTSGLRHACHPPAKQTLAEQVERGSAEDHRRADAFGRLVWPGDEQIIADRGRSGDDDRLAEGDDDEQLAALGEVASLDVLVGRGRAAATRAASSRRRARRARARGPVSTARAAGRRRALRRPATARRTRRSRRPAARTRRGAGGGASAAGRRRRCGPPAGRRSSPQTAVHAHRTPPATAAAMSRLPSITAVSTAADRRGGRVEPVGHPRRVDPCPPDDEQQERGPRHAGDGGVIEDLVRQLRDREDVDEVEEQLDGRRRLRRAVAPRPQVADRRGGRGGHRPGGPWRASATIRCGRRSRRARPARRRRCTSSDPWPPGARGSGGRAGTASTGPRRGVRGRARARGRGRRRGRRGSPAAGRRGAREEHDAATSTARSASPAARPPREASSSSSRRW